MMRVFTSTTFTGHWPVGVAAVIVAHNEQAAEKLLREKLAEVGLPQEPDEAFNLTEVDTSTLGAIILQDGDY